MTVAELKEMLSEIKNSSVKNGRSRIGPIRFRSLFGDDVFTANIISRDDFGDVLLVSSGKNEEAYTLDQIESGISAFGDDTEVLFDVVGKDLYEIIGSWRMDDEGNVTVTVYDPLGEFDDDYDGSDVSSDSEVDDDYDDVSSDSEVEDGEGDTMTVGRLRSVLAIFNSDKVLYVSDGEVIDNFTVDAVYLRNGEAVLQSNEIEDTQEYSFTVGYVQYCLAWFEEDAPACFMYCDEDNDFVFYDIVDYHVDDDGDLVLDVSLR